MRSPWTALPSMFGVFLIVSTACDTQRLTPVEEVPVASITVTPPELSIAVGARIAVLAIPVGSGGSTLSRSIAWSSSNPAIAAVSQTGDASAEVLGVAVGTTSITASSGGKSSSITVTVTQQPVVSVDTVVIAPTSASVDAGQTVQLTAVAKDAGGNVLPGRTVNWSSSNTSIATVSGFGLVTGVAPGSVVITAASEGQQTTATITVMTPPATPIASVDVAPATATVVAGQTVQLTATARDASGTALTGRSITWASANAAVATVSASGLVTGVSGGGVTITATSEGKAGTASVTVTSPPPPPPPPVASVSVSPTAPSVAVGQTIQLTATVRDASGNTLTDRVVTWTSANTTVATVSSTGLVTGRAGGSSTVTATSEGVSGAATVTVTTTVTDPATVSTLAVSSATASSVTLSFTEVTDGAGRPASYEVRYAISPLSWGSATPVAQGTCAVPLAGTTIGAVRSCTVQGLAAGTSYQFQLVAFRGALNVDAVFGALSNVASGTTAASTAPVATVTVSPPSVSLGVGGTQQLTAVLADASGNTLTGRVVTWSSSSPSTATVSSAGLLTAVAVGTATVTASSEGRSGAATVTIVTAPPPGGWPNEPAGFTMVRDAAWNAVTPSGWLAAYNEDNLATVAADATAPHSASNVLQFRYPAGFAGGSAPATIYTSGGITAKEYFIGMWWKPSNPWHGHSSSINKVFFFYTESWADLVMTMYGPNGGPYHLRVVTQGMPSSGTYMTQNVNVIPVVLGQWHRIEVHAKYDSYYGARDGFIRWWVNGILVGSHTGLGFPNDAGFREFQLSPTWGGLGGTKAQQDYYWYDHVYLSRK